MVSPQARYEWDKRYTYKSCIKCGIQFNFGDSFYTIHTHVCGENQFHPNTFQIEKTGRLCAKCVKSNN